MLEPKCRKAMKGWPDSKVEEYERQADILTDMMIEMYLAGVAVGGPKPRRGRWFPTKSAKSWKSVRP